MAERKKLSDILHGADLEALAKKWQETDAAADFAPLPPGEYLLRILSGRYFNAKSGTPGYKLTLEVTEGEYAGRRAWHDLWLTSEAFPMTKRDLGKLGVVDLEQLERPLPAGILIRAKIALRKSDSGTEYNRVDHFVPAGIEKADPFAPHTEKGEEDGAATDADEIADADSSSEPFPFGANAPARNSIAPGPYDRSERR